MKRFLLILSFMLCTVNFAQDLSGVKILIYSAPQSVEEKNIIDVKINFYKHLLKNFGTEVFTIDNTEENFTLSQLAAFVNQNEIDFIHAISNTDFIESEKENYSLVIYNSFENYDAEDAGKLILDGVANSNRAENKYLSDKNENEFSGDFFMGLNAPGIISVDSKIKLNLSKNNYKNKEFLKNEVWGYIRGLINFYETNPFNKGFVAGFVRDKSEKLDKQLSDGEDVLKPINNVKVTLQPGGKSYVSDFNNNGFFYFDSLEPGEYKLIFEAGTYSSDSTIITVASNQTTFADMLLKKDFSIPPSVYNYNPHDTTEKADTESEIKIVFSIPMDQESTEDAFRIEPDIDGEFEWSNEDHILVFKPDNAMEIASRYKVIIDSTATGKNNIKLEKAEEFYFDTKEHYVDIIKNNISEVGDSIITTQKIEFTFSKPMDRDEVEDEFEIIPVGDNIEYEVEGSFDWSDNFTKMTFIPNRAYRPATKYMVIISEDAETINGLELGYDYKTEFFTRASHIHPRIVSSKPINNTDTVFINTDITLEFNEPMNREEFYKAFSITPVIEGKFEWSNNNTKMKFIPGKLLNPATEYKINIKSSAANNFSIPLNEDFSFVFKTNNRGRLQLVNNYPSENEKNISTTSGIKLEFNYPVEMNTLLENISLLSSNGKEIRLKDFKTIAGNTFSVFAKPETPLNNNTQYRLVLSKEIKDELEIPLVDNITVNFKTENEVDFEGDILEGFEENKSWMKIDSNKISKGIESNKTFFENNVNNKISGKFSGKISYEFNEPEGILALQKKTPLNLSKGGGEIGIWIYGDLSSNIFSLILINDKNENLEVKIDTLNWSGWKLKKFSLTNFSSNSYALKSILIKHTKFGEMSGEIFIDDIQISKTSTLAEKEESIPNEYSLEQNYPNPFNPTTTISFKMPKSSVVTLDVLNILGQKVRNLIHKENYSAGTWSVEWDGKSDYGDFMPSGVYLYKIKTDEFTEVKKMILVK